MALTPLKAGRGEGGGFKEGKSRRCLTTSTRRLQGVSWVAGQSEVA
jgi:hypothetical protein